MIWLTFLQNGDRISVAIIRIDNSIILLRNEKFYQLCYQNLSLNNIYYQDGLNRVKLDKCYIRYHLMTFNLHI